MGSDRGDGAQSHNQKQNSERESKQPEVQALQLDRLRVARHHGSHPGWVEIRYRKIKEQGQIAGPGYANQHHKQEKA